MYLTSEQKVQLMSEIVKALDELNTGDGTEENLLVVDDFAEIGTQLRSVRMKKNIALTDLAKQVGITQAFMCKVEHNQLTMTKIRQLLAWVKALGFDGVILRP